MNLFRAKRVSWTCFIDLKSDIKRVFLLFTPNGEKKWVKDWDFEPVFPYPFYLEEKCVFKTGTHDYKSEEAIWIINKYQPEQYRIEYIRLESAAKMGHIQITCKSKNRNRTEVGVTYTYTGLTDEGNIFIENFTKEKYIKYIKDWERALTHYLQTGTILE